MSNADVADVKQAQVSDLLSKEGNTIAASRGKLVNEMFVSATTYLEDYARRTGDDRPSRTWIGYQEVVYDLRSLIFLPPLKIICLLQAWRKHVADSISFVGKMKDAYSGALFRFSLSLYLD